MFLQSKNHLYVYNHKSKYLIPLHPVVARFAMEAKQGKDIDLKETEKELAKDYSKDEIALLYLQYLHFKEHSFFEADIKKMYGKISNELIRDAFNSVTHLVFEVTEGCNLQCHYCAYGDYYVNRGERSAKSMTFALAKTLLLHFVPIWKSNMTRNLKKQISIGFYGGEPLLNYELIAQIVGFCESLGFKKDFFRFSMTTNGLLIKKYQDFLIDKNIYISVSLDGNKENNAYRIKKDGENSFDEIIENVNSIKEKNKEYFEKNVEFMGVIHNKNSMEQILTFCKEKFDKMPTLSPLSIDNVNPQKQEQFDKMYKGIIDDLTKEFVLSLTDVELGKYDFLFYLRKNCQHIFLYYMSVYNAKKTVPILPTGTCIPFSRKIFLSTEGKILPCERISILYSLGSIEENKEIILDYNAISKIFNNTILKYKDECLDCFNKNSCSLCAFKCSNDDDKCEEFVSEEQFIEKMESYLTLVETYPHLYKYSKSIVIG